MKKKKRNTNQGSNVRGTLVGFFLMFCAIALLFGWVYKIGVNRPPLKYALIPESTIEYLRNLNNINPGQGFNLSDEGPMDWDNDEDFGQTASGDMKWRFEEDENFIVYYHKDKDALWQGYAQQVLKYADAAIPSMIDLMGRYYYPKDMNGRKLAIYLAESENVYNNTINQLMNTNPASRHTGSIGITIFSIGRTGCMTDGIVIHPDCFKDDPHGENGYYKVLLHEMNHYVFFSSLDYSKPIKHYLWVSEGIAEYYCQRNDGKQISSPEAIAFIEQKCALNSEFPLTDNSAYWAGESFYLHLGNQNEKRVKDFINLAYTTSTDSVFILSKMDQSTTHKKWVEDLRAHQLLETEEMPEEPEVQ